MHHKFCLIFMAYIMSVFLAACSSSPKERETPLVMNNVLAADAPCWIRNPECMLVEGEDAVYFVGRSENALPNWGSPQRESFDSARKDAELQYARFLGVDITSSIFMQELLNNQQYQSQFKQTITEDFKHRLSDIKKVDEYFIALHETDRGEPLWLVYMLIKVNLDIVEKHRLAAIEESIKRENEAEDEWVAFLYNIDDSVSVYVNDVKINQCDLAQSCEVALSPHLEFGKNTLRLEYQNAALWWAYGYQILKNNTTMYQGKCGQVWLFGCKNDTTIGMVHEFEIEIEKPIKK